MTPAVWPLIPDISQDKWLKIDSHLRPNEDAISGVTNDIYK